MQKEEKFIFLRDTDLTSLCLDGDRIRLRSIDESYAPVIFQEFSEEIARYMLPKSPEKIDETLTFIRSSQAKMKEGSEVILLILKKEDEEFIGCCGLHARVHVMTPGLGIWIRKAAHGSKYGWEAIRVLSRWAKENMAFDYLVYGADRRNIPSRKIPESMGGILYEEKKTLTMRGDYLDEVVYKITREQI